MVGCSGCWGAVGQLGALRSQARGLTWFWAEHRMQVWLPECSGAACTAWCSAQPVVRSPARAAARLATKAPCQLSVGGRLPPCQRPATVRMQGEGWVHRQGRGRGGGPGEGASGSLLPDLLHPARRAQGTRAGQGAGLPPHGRAAAPLEGGCTCSTWGGGCGWAAAWREAVLGARCVIGAGGGGGGSSSSSSGWISYVLGALSAERWGRATGGGGQQGVPYAVRAS